MNTPKGWYEGISMPRSSICIGCEGKIPYLSVPHNEKRLNSRSKSGITSTYSVESWSRQLCTLCKSSISYIQQIGCLHCGRAVRCTDCERHPLLVHGLTANRSAVVYSEAMKAWLHRFKFQGDAGYAAIMAGMMLHRYELLAATIARFHPQIPNGRLPLYERLRRWLYQLPSVPYPDIVTFVPSTAERLKERGFNPAERLATLLATEWGRPVMPLLMRTTDQGRQSHLGRSGRELTIAGAYRCHTKALQSLIPNTSSKYPIYILLVDDVYTTGSTVRACAGALTGVFRNNGISAVICSYTWARA
ncbi:hypothetical protein NQ117_13975 [Paenibacillus sp. SC116]|uniref:ComF family protein n=1 Tax=Paenibacillus sp. SC116 TaxID=2968986 RepID=UPI00215B0C5E|nr:hypothetical protein [Paenibacillus sp. SC116]MCR8844795.1 hypothetical protein [Paenibacillus sp. SC116]